MKRLEGSAAVLVIPVAVSAICYGAAVIAASLGDPSSAARLRNAASQVEGWLTDSAEAIGSFFSRLFDGSPPETAQASFAQALQNIQQSTSLSTGYSFAGTYSLAPAQSFAIPDDNSDAKWMAVGELRADIASTDSMFQHDPNGMDCKQLQEEYVALGQALAAINTNYAAVIDLFAGHPSEMVLDALAVADYRTNHIVFRMQQVRDAYHRKGCKKPFWMAR